MDRYCRSCHGEFTPQELSRNSPSIASILHDFLDFVKAPGRDLYDLYINHNISNKGTTKGRGLPARLPSCYHASMIRDWHKQTAPVLLVRNEEYWIGPVLSPLLVTFGLALVADTGSSDDTVAIARKAGAEVLELGELSPQELGQARRHLGKLAARRGCRWIFQVDGDELYHPSTLRHITSQPIPQERIAGFTSMLTVDGDYQGDKLLALYELDDLFSRLALIPATCKWNGEYPFEAPAVFAEPEAYFYFNLPQGFRYHAIHLHRLIRSPHDSEVFLRQQKRFQFAMQDKQIARLGPFDLDAWLQAGG